MNITTFRDKIKKRLGWPLLNIELTDDQIDERIDDSLELFINWCSEGTTAYILALNTTENQKIYTLPNNIFSVVKMLEYSSEFPQVGTILKEQLLYSIPNIDILSYNIFNSYIRDINAITQPRYDFSFNKISHKLTFFTNPPLGTQFFRVYLDNSVDDLESIFDDNWFLRYTEALCRRQWSQNLGKFSKDMIGGGSVNYSDIYSQASEEITRLEEELFSRRQEPIDFIIG